MIRREANVRIEAGRSQADGSQHWLRSADETAAKVRAQLGLSLMNYANERPGFTPFGASGFRRVRADTRACTARTHCGSRLVPA